MNRIETKHLLVIIIILLCVIVVNLVNINNSLKSKRSNISLDTMQLQELTNTIERSGYNSDVEEINKNVRYIYDYLTSE